MSLLILFINITLILVFTYSLTILVFIAGMRKRRSGSMPPLEKVTVIIAARNEEASIGNILNDLCRQSYPRDRYEIIVINDHSTDGTAKVVRRFVDRTSNIQLLHVREIPPNFSPKKYAMQTAVEKASGTLILATDADCRVGPDWIRSMASCFEPDVGFIIGFSQFGRAGQSQSLLKNLQAVDFVTLMGAAAGSANLGFPLAASGQNLGYRKTAFQKVGGYDKVSHRVSGDDVLLLQLIRKYTDYRIVYASDPESFAVSEPQPTLKALINQRKRWASNGSFQIHLNFPFFLYLLQVLLYNTALMIGFFLSLILGQYILFFIGCLAARALMELIMTVRSAFYFKRTDLIKFYPIWFLVQIPYVVGVGIAGTFGSFRWKERRYRPEVKTGA